MPSCRCARFTFAALLAGSCCAAIAQPDPPDPFAGLTPAAQAQTTEARASWIKRFFQDNFAFKKELMSEFDSDAEGSAASRQSVGFEVWKRFSDSTSTIASFDFQGRMVRRDGYNAVPNDMEGMDRQGWAFEYHNLYVDVYNFLNPLLASGKRGRNAGRFNFRAGHFYVPVGINLQTDTHGTLLQLSNGEDFGFDRDWYAGFWGSINRYLNYDLDYLAGSGYDLKFKGQSGMGALRISLGNRLSARYGLEGGVSAIGGERLATAQAMGERTDTAVAPLATRRIGANARYRRTAPHGLLTFTSELNSGRDGMNAVHTQLAQAEYLRASRRWGFGTQFRRFDRGNAGTDAAAIGEFTWYFRNDVANTNSHWIKLNVERVIQAAVGRPRTVVTLEYYFYL